MRYLRTITRQRPAVAQFDFAFQKISLTTAIVELSIFLRDTLGKDESNGS